MEIRIIDNTSSVECDLLVVNKFEEEKTTEELNEVNKDVVNSDYEILAGEDGFFRVRKKGSERTLRKFATEAEAIDFIEKKRV